MKVSVAITLLNEASTVSSLLDSLINQTKLPDEIIIVDGGSKDATVEIIKEYQSKNPRIKLIETKGNIAAGRNIAIKEAQFEIIAQTDGGCIANPDWLEKITKPLEDPKIGMVAGFYDMVAKSPFQEALAPFHGVPKRKFDPRHFMPSGRSVAFRKEVWEYVGGYSENLERAGEDTLFNYKVLSAGVRIKSEPKAIVRWQIPSSFMGSLKKFYTYAVGDAEAGIWWHPAQRLCTHNIKIMGIFARYIVGFALLFASPFFPFLFLVVVYGFIFYTSWSIWKMREDVEGMRARLLLPIIQISSDLAIMAGFVSGSLSRLAPKKTN